MKAIVSLATKRGNYYKGLQRLGDSLKDNFDGDFIGLMGEQSVGAPMHVNNPYAFKLFAIAHARNLGYNQILWLDTSVYAIGNVQPVFDIIQQKGWFMQEAGAWLKDWCNPFTDKYFNLTNEERQTFHMYSAGFTGLNFENETAREFFDQWNKSMIAGCFRGDWSNHRHDMTCASIIAHRLGMGFEKGDSYFQYAAPETPLNNETIVFKVQGV